MIETDLNKKYICEKTGLNEKDDLVNIILEMIKDSFKSGLNQSEYDNTIDIMEENIKLRELLNDIINNLTISINSINKKLIEDKKIKVKEGRLLNMNGYQKVRLKAIRTKCKELLNFIERINDEN